MHVQDIGWMDWVKNSKPAGTTGQSLRVEAIQIKVENPPVKYNYNDRIYSFFDGEYLNLPLVTNYQIEKVNVKILMLTYLQVRRFIKHLNIRKHEKFLDKLDIHYTAVG